MTADLACNIEPYLRIPRRKRLIFAAFLYGWSTISQRGHMIFHYRTNQIYETSVSTDEICAGTLSVKYTG